MEILDTYWFTNTTGVTGVVKVLDKWDGIKYYIGAAGGYDSSRDAEQIAKWGSSFPVVSGDKLFGV
jgi:hypothetical protein